jgi:hypothetical protein
VNGERGEARNAFVHRPILSMLLGKAPIAGL